MTVAGFDLPLRPMLATLSRHRTATILIVLEIALASAILGNAVFLIGRRLALMNIDSGVDPAGLVVFALTESGPQDRAGERAGQTLAALRALPGVHGAALLNAVPFSRLNWQVAVASRPDDAGAVGVISYMGGPGTLSTLGLRLVAGRDFAADEYMDLGPSPFPQPPAVILTRALAQRLYPQGDALGKPLYIGDKGATIVGIVGHLAVAQPDRPGFEDDAVLEPVRPIGAVAQFYAVRADAAAAPAVIAAGRAQLRRLQPQLMVIKAQTFAQLRRDFFARDRDMAGLLTAVCVALLLITALGIVGLTSFWVQGRTRAIGIRRALGATRADILRYFQVENLLIAGIGTLLGVGATYGLNLGLLRLFEVPRLPLDYMPVGCAMLLLLGQIAVLGPALRASRVPPVVATRNL